ncbi:histidinol phosphate phosphatase domain-containing protein [Lederbergia citrea]|uniref:histidinol phosphate phosphatase domain-containing protein n=1 Tax=Lederbergia citrea TaxID=2833581 RepID=UPI001BCA5445|nr:histidinol phosphate phosphatase domain-containing protein [Lederbergia citrea]MBS4206218.1 histidinol phosphate phosphatase domain-containing protein [Lederbergia citrea]
MKVDYHFHLEEGPYSSRWLKRTFDAIDHFNDSQHEAHTREWLKEALATLGKRIEHGPFSEEWLDLYLEQAKRLDLKEVGIVDHLYRFKEYKPYYEKHMYLRNDELGKLQRSWLDKVCVESIQSFIELIENAKPKWMEEGIELRLGLEADYFLNGEEELAGILKENQYDYIIGSVHFLDGWGFDNPQTQELFLNHDLYTLYEEFFNLVENAISSRLFDFIAHLDNIKLFGYRPNEEELIPFYERIAKKLSELDLATEINAGLYYRYPIKEMCPSPTFLKILAENKVEMTISSDAHFPDDLGNYAAEQLDILKKLGIDEVTTFKQRKKLKHPIEFIVC